MAQGSRIALGSDIRGFATGRNLLLLVALVVGSMWMSNYYNVWHEREINRSVAAGMLTAAMPAQVAINRNVTRIGTLAGSGKGIEIPQSSAGSGTIAREVEWTIADDGHIRGRTADRDRITIDWTPSLNGTSVTWTCKFTFPERRAPQSLPPCPEIR